MFLDSDSYHGFLPHAASVKRKCHLTKQEMRRQHSRGGKRTKQALRYHQKHGNPYPYQKTENLTDVNRWGYSRIVHCNDG